MRIPESRLVRNVPVMDVQADEIWMFVRWKEKNKRDQDDVTSGDAWCYVAPERRSKLVLAFQLGKRDRITAEDFMSQLRQATADQNFQLTTDGLQAYIGAVDASLSDRADYARLVKIYAAPREGEQRYSPAEVVNAVPVPVMAILTRSESAHRTLSVKISPCECRFAG